ncbi:acylphosphatase [Niabella aurantiaca]|uniref:acylphosphatase n=1 Tax=Niabella aurantiaca TaxID=379900 RepID=UPI000370D0DF|nr:acylphosphatase [Niabella aurantiaca]
MNTTQITIKGNTIRAALQQALQLKAEELGITGTMQSNKNNTVTLITSGTRDNLERYIDWCASAAREHGVEIAETRDLAFKAFYRFS